MSKVYGSVGLCGFCLGSGVKLHCKIDGIINCQRCYSRKRYSNPAKREVMKGHARNYQLKKRQAKKRNNVCKHAATAK